LVVLVAAQSSVIGLYLLPVFITPNSNEYPPQTIISVPVQTAVWALRAEGAVAVGVQLSVLGLYFPPVFNP